MNKAKIWRIVIIIIVVGLIGSGINRTMHLNKLANDLLNGSEDQQIKAATELMKRDKLFEKMQVMDSTDRIKIMDAIAQIPGDLTIKQTLPLFKDTEAKLRTNTLVIETDNKIRGLQFYQDEKTLKTNAPLLEAARQEKDRLKKLQDDEVKLHAKIVDVLKVLAKNSIDMLVPEMKNPDVNVGIGVKDTLVAIGEKVIPYMKTAALEDDLRPHAFEVMQRVGEPSIPSLIVLLNHKLGSSDTQNIRMAAAGALGAIGKKSATDALMKATSDVEAVRRIAVSSLCAIRDPKSTDVLIYVLSHTTDDGEVRARSATALSVIGGQKAINTLVGAIDDLDLKVQSSAISGLQRIGDPAVAPVTAAIKSGDPRLAKFGAEVLSRINSPAAADVLISLTKNSDPDIRASAVDGLGFQTDNPRIDALVSMLGDTNGAVGDMASSVLANIGARSVNSLINIINSGANDVTKYRASATLGKIGSAAVPQLSSIANAGGSNLRWALYALGHSGDPKAKAILEKYASSQDPNMAAIVESTIHRFK